MKFFERKDLFVQYCMGKVPNFLLCPVKAGVICVSKCKTYGIPILHFWNIIVVTRLFVRVFCQCASSPKEMTWRNTISIFCFMRLKRSVSKRRGIFKNDKYMFVTTARSIRSYSRQWFPTCVPLIRIRSWFPGGP